MSDIPANTPAFSALGLSEPLLRALDAVGYETPSPIQARTIPPLLAGRDVLGQAQTGTGKTAAFALPLLSRLDLARHAPQVLVLVPTRELAIQVAEAFQRYAAFLPGFHIAPVYGGQDMRGQLAQLKRGVHVVVGTPGRVMDHMRRGSLKLDALQALVLDEADEMLRMGFIDDVNWILEQTPPERQLALFSATLPPAIQRIAETHLREPEQVSIEVKTTTAETIRQRYWYVSGLHKLDALTRILEVEQFDGIIVFVRTKTATLELAEKLQARGYSATALNGDIPQRQREQVVQSFKTGGLDILVATDVAARGLDVDRVSHVINYDIPYDTEAYVHRIGRTGRAGRKGEAILFVAPREKRLLSLIERATRQKIEEMQLPTTEAINDRRVANFHQRITDTLAAGELEFFRELVDAYQREHDMPALDIAAALAKLAQHGKPLLLKARAEQAPAEKAERRTKQELRAQRDEKFREEAYGSRKRRGDEGPPPAGMERFRIEVGHDHGVKPGNIMGAIANEAGLEGQYIGRIQIFGDHSLVDLPEGMPREIFNDLKKTRVAGQTLRIARLDGRTEAVDGTAGTELPPFGGKARALEAASRETRSDTHERPARPHKDAAPHRAERETRPRPAASRPGRSQDTRSRDGKPRDAKPRDANPRDAKPRDAKPRDAKPRDGKPRDAKPRDAKPRAAKPHDARRRDTKPGGKKFAGASGEKTSPSAAGKRKQRPGKNARLAAKGAKPGAGTERPRRPGTLTTRKKTP